jgi:hypothetical protein
VILPGKLAVGTMHFPMAQPKIEFSECRVLLAGILIGR